MSVSIKVEKTTKIQVHLTDKLGVKHVIDISEDEAIKIYNELSRLYGLKYKPMPPEDPWSGRYWTGSPYLPSPIRYECK